MFTTEEYQSALEWLFTQMPNYQIDGQKAYKPGLDNIKKLCDFFGNPQNKLKTIHIGGTNGKGSTSNMLASVLQEQGYKVGLYNSPHLVEFTERIKVDGTNANKSFVFDFINKLKNLPKDIKPSFFEFTTIMAFQYFYEQKVDFAIIEVGLGGRLDATNIISPLVSAITNIALDHQNLLGETLEEIATEKAGIIKPKTTIICGEEQPEIKKVIQENAQSKEANFIDATSIATPYKTDLKGDYQKKNIRVVIEIIQELKKLGFQISDQSIKNGLFNVHNNTKFMGRWFEVSKNPLVVCDTGHNHAGLTEVFKQLNAIPKKKHIVIGFVNDKKIEPVFDLTSPKDHYYFVKPQINRGLHPKNYENLIQNKGLNYQIFDDVNEGYNAAKRLCKADEMIFIGGSNFVVGDFLEKNLPVNK
ncbi:bifunctional folylpolyglutamate synthase/dihydrofolate synthase [Riemerella anatipestifer]|uniref:Dihydrofolate synthase/folylpolyglutamate synthase n=2 Tax=Riemerella anatipestifer TaxID=34085 RepID=J9R463_RIEAN|nr:folylpolyglutamate synthase/dihydrofolate synthase family protein [Riemerella anatipestifer]AFR35193.1 Folylpolyglutamate synthase [Riemerella anatipestifer RA-CH-1]AIH02211.1 folc bifunctional protein [Riemerella anatipestifer CH3]AQY22126.1 Bifunctional protein FolC [Riemerella anatipestifer]MBO4233488.1 bifunctional folylpolyglutamate synthase/dihydrofolate synthase [Riemerella anatipestifer]MCO4303918.1 bifunctional folylpolyglutamate synthase/dihydrofolate synthase [Riemerella anatipes